MTIDEQPKSPQLRFLTAFFCPYAQRARIALEWYKLPYEHIECLSPGPDGYTKHLLLLETNPKGLVPTLIVDHSDGRREIVVESLDIIEYLDTIARGMGLPIQPLVPEDRKERRRLRKAAQIYNASFCDRFIQCFRRNRPDRFSDMIAALENFSSEMLGPFYNGASLCIVDVALYPFAYATSVLGASKGPDFTLSRDNHPQLGKYFDWLSKMSELAVVKQTLMPPRQLIQTYDHLTKLSTAQGKPSRRVNDAKLESTTRLTHSSKL
ncbi:Glutathione S-transferase 103-1A, putative [Perkinsus marinus ATCC 50983]|uniref:Glutathione S-transferase 103-1A, putative n=1 Tax=Perkinsus marinus (strain ATCC 50983 / TXsc) TaxID=423536 RepID=C5KH67_PERM5|nr:Glutathione S-transferase 103-1A, putative [Perkinsus marinus ATCC 50983]EER15929.1 Glutathione S-transferase 103-1A, putative [Perkinsus marinus ATCC 50983]|eukprot:XP_002784133.1 Glutathione S-transferase 103-1A, putative [Perkinsus marinus ATCC 50983]